MAKETKTVFVCSSCGHSEAKWLGRCPSCGQWNTLTESAVGNAKRGRNEKPRALSMPLSAINPDEGKRYNSGFSEVDRVLGGGIMRGSSVLVGGEPGIGKSTLLLQIAASAETDEPVLYISGEESAAHIRLRAERLGVGKKNMHVMCSGDMTEIMSALESVRPALFFVDSLQTLVSPEAGGIPGTVNQIKYCSLELSDWAREHGSAAFLVAHITKDGLIAGPKAAEHTVDVVLMFEQSDSDIRFLRALKNRFGSSEELGLFTMTDAGLREIADPSDLFVVRRDGSDIPPGIAVAATWEGSRALLVEIQALTVPCKAALSRVYSERIEPARVARVAAVLEKHLTLSLSDQDIYVNVAGGIKLSESGIDLALAAALYSARSGIAVQRRICMAGELSLAGELRPVRRMAGRFKAAASMGFTGMVGAHDQADSEKSDAWQGAATINEALRLMFGKKFS